MYARGNNGLSLRAKRVILFALTSSGQSVIVYRRISRLVARRIGLSGIKAKANQHKKKKKINNKKVRFQFGFGQNDHSRSMQLLISI